MIKLYDTVKIKETGQIAAVVEIDDDDGRKPPFYLLEVIDKPDDAEMEDVIFSCKWDEVEEVKEN